MCDKTCKNFSASIENCHVNIKNLIILIQSRQLIFRCIMDHCFLTYTYSKVSLEQFYYVNQLNSTCVYRKWSHSIIYTINEKSTKLMFVSVTRTVLF